MLHYLPRHDRPSWVAELPEKMRPYANLARLNRPIGIWLAVWPAFWSITLAANPGQLPDFKTMALFGIATIFLRGAGCTANDIFDRDFDAQVRRTKNRPIASGVVSLFQGWSFFAFQTLVGLGFILRLHLCSHFILFSVVGMILAYPLAKRITYWPQAFLGCVISGWALLGWFSIKGSLSLSVILPLCTASAFWVLVFDTIYAHQDKEDDVKAGVKSTALLFGDLTKYWISGFGLACVTGLALTGYNAHLSWPYYPCLIASAGQLARQIRRVDLSNPDECAQTFISNHWFGVMLFIGFLFGRIV